MRTRLAIRFDTMLEAWFPERRLFLKSDTDTRFIRLRPHTQMIGFAGSTLLVAWAIIATAIILMDSIGAGNFRDQARRDQQTYEARLNALAQERDARASEAQAAQERFNSTLEQVSQMQTELLASETRRRELETGIDVIQTTLRRTLKERDAIKRKVAALTDGDQSASQANVTEAESEAMDMVIAALADTATERDIIATDARDAVKTAKELEFQIRLMQDQNDQIFRQLEEAMAVSVKPLDKMFRSAGMNTETILDQVRSGYSGQGGPLMPISFSTKSQELTPDEVRANRILQQMDKLNLYRIAAEKAPFNNPVRASFRFTSPFGNRRHPVTGGNRMHDGVDFAAPIGTDIFATADGVVTYAGWQSGYGRIVKIRHEFGVETRYAHMSRIRVKKGQKVSRGDHIGDMGNSGRSTGSHVHYEVRVNGKPVNPMTYIKAARNVF
ncbi:MAG: M23 family peptidase [Sediminimonas qiaohouensis]|uniref:M23 family peptidase n=1 Tax=Sediminimonas qiaohouensis TaxID=552061 RepID=A0A7C9HLB5_9RHOB|nr:M23 family metallopeptidase [Sediminimonas qiaohouensis]MTJ04308.1 M23 family peptidase [Sediminimonas qiaohouensis]